jgi:nucleoside-diphosphate-sugar epimerase
MKNILVIGSTGQIGSELTMKLRNMYPEGTVVAGYIKVQSLRAFFSKAALLRRPMSATVPN